MYAKYVDRGIYHFYFKNFYHTLFSFKIYFGESCTLVYNNTFWLNLYDFRTKIAQDIERLIHQSDIIDRVVYDLDNPK